jgi:NAD(P)H-dependent flavin oxidoreductase YrpB (nitropropane dioxygenase family)
MRKISRDIREDSVDGFVVEGKEAGGHNAPERAERPGRNNGFSYDEIADFGRPFWIADGAISLKEAKENKKAAGIQR